MWAPLHAVRSQHCYSRPSVRQAQRNLQHPDAPSPASCWREHVAKRTCSSGRGRPGARRCRQLPARLPLPSTACKLPHAKLQHRRCESFSKPALQRPCCCPCKQQVGAVVSCCTSCQGACLSRRGLLPRGCVADSSLPVPPWASVYTPMLEVNTKEPAPVHCPSALRTWGARSRSAAEQNSLTLGLLGS